MELMIICGAIKQLLKISGTTYQFTEPKTTIA